ncbi:MAG: RNA polymerase sigma factor [Acidimicrobiia bacterium]|nr:RNA polymerase sigma factor [Acidimicrobiia bacterium]
MNRPRNDRSSEATSPSSRDDFVSHLQACDRRMRALAYTMLGSSAAMDDVLQEAYLKAFRALGGFRGESSFATWLGAIVYRCCLDHSRSTARHRWSSLDTIGDDRLTDGRRPDDTVDAHLTVMTALGQLGADHRAVLVLVDLEGLSTREAAELLGVPSGTVASRLSRARDALREVLRSTDWTIDNPSPADESGKDSQ